MFDPIVLPLDGSDLAEAVIPRATEMARKFGARILLVQAVETLAQRLMTPADVLESPGAAAANIRALEAGLEAQKQEAWRYLGSVRDRLAADGVSVEALVGDGAAKEVILGLAADRKADLIAMSTHGRGGLGRLVFGSVADAVLHQATIPVLLIRSGA